MDSDVQKGKQPGKKKVDGPASGPRPRRRAAARTAGSSRSKAPPAAVVEPVAATSAADETGDAFRLPGTCTIHEAADLKTGLLSLLEAPGAISLDGDAVERIDTAGVLTLAAFIRSCRRDGRSVSWRRHSGEIQRAAALLGAHALLGLPAGER